MPGQKPQYDVMIPVDFGMADKKVATKWNSVGVAWVKVKGVITFNIETMPGVRFLLVEKQEGAS